MPAPDFSLALERLENGTTVLVLAGEIDLYRAPEIERALDEAIEAGEDRHRWGGRCGTLSTNGGENADEDRRSVTVDLRSVTFLDSTMLAILLAASGRQRARGSELIVLVGPRTPTTAFEVTGFDRLLAIRRTDAQQVEIEA